FQPAFLEPVPHYLTAHTGTQPPAAFHATMPSRDHVVLMHSYGQRRRIDKTIVMQQLRRPAAGIRPKVQRIGTEVAAAIGDVGPIATGGARGNGVSPQVHAKTAIRHTARVIGEPTLSQLDYATGLIDFDPHCGPAVTLADSPGHAALPPAIAHAVHNRRDSARLFIGMGDSANRRLAAASGGIPVHAVSGDSSLIRLPAD